MNFIKTVAIFMVGVVIGALEENIRYGIIYHEAKKGDGEAAKIIEEFDMVGETIEDICK